MQPGSHSIVVMPHVEWATNTVQMPSRKPALSSAFCACDGDIDDLAVAVRVERELLVLCLHASSLPPCAPANPARPAADSTEGPARPAFRRVVAASSGPLPVPEALLAPLIETAGDTLRTLDATEVPPALQHLQSFDRRGFMHGPAPKQVGKVLEHDEAFRETVGERFGERAEVRTLLDEWERGPGCGAGRSGRRARRPRPARIDVVGDAPRRIRVRARRRPRAGRVLLMRQSALAGIWRWRRWPWLSVWRGRGIAAADLPGAEQARQVLAGFRGLLYRCLTRRGDELFELGDAVLCADGPVQDLARLSLVAGHRRGHGAVYDALNAGRVDIGRLRRALAGLPLQTGPDGGIRLAVDVSPWLRPQAATSAGLLFCHVYGRGKGSAQIIPGWPYSVVAALEPGRTSWTAVLDAVRLRPDDDETE